MVSRIDVEEDHKSVIVRVAHNNVWGILQQDQVVKLPQPWWLVQVVGKPLFYFLRWTCWATALSD